MSEEVGTARQDSKEDIVFSPSEEHSKMEAPEVKETPKRQLAHTMMKIRLANRMVRGKRLVKAPSQLSMKGHVETASRRHPFTRKCSKLRIKKKPLPHRSKKWWSVVTKRKATCLLYLFCVIVGVQMYNAYENLDDNLAIYDIDQLEKTLHQNLLGQTLAINKLTKLMRSYFSTYIHTKPLFLSINGPIGVGKSYLGRLIAKHFKFELGPHLILQHSMKYQHLMDHCNQRSQHQLATQISAIFSRALQAQRIPVLLFDEMELASAELLSFIGQRLHSNHTNAVYIFISNVGQDAITRSIRRRVTRKETGHVKRLSLELARLFARRHPVWQAPEIIPLFPLDWAHVVQCFHEVMDREGFYPRDPRAEAMASTFNYYKARQRFYSHHGCKNVPVIVKQLNGQKRAEDFGSKMVIRRQKRDGNDSCQTFSIFKHPSMNY